MMDHIKYIYILISSIVNLTVTTVIVVVFNINEFFVVVKFNFKQVLILCSQFSHGFNLDRMSLYTQLFDVHYGTNVINLRVTA